jgi:hypothetical protein
MLAMLKTIWKSMFSPEPKTPAKRDSDGTQWCLVGNIVAERKCGVGGTETRRGTKHFSAGTKVFCPPAQWGDGYDQIVVIGRHRGSKRFVTMIISSDWVTNWRAKVVYDLAALELLATIEQEQGRSNWRTKEEVEQDVTSMKHRQSKPNAS